VHVSARGGTNGGTPPTGSRKRRTVASASGRGVGLRLRGHQWVAYEREVGLRACLVPAYAGGAGARSLRGVAPLCTPLAVRAWHVGDKGSLRLHGRLSRHRAAAM
jgi:hypothetical protein